MPASLYDQFLDKVAPCHGAARRLRDEYKPDELFDLESKYEKHVKMRDSHGMKYHGKRLDEYRAQLLRDLWAAFQRGEI